MVSGHCEVRSGTSKRHKQAAQASGYQMRSKQMLNGRYKFRDKQWAFPHRQGLAGSNKLAAVGSLEGQICKIKYKYHLS